MAKSIWNTQTNLEEINQFNQKTCHHLLGVRFTALGEDYLEATMPVDDRTRNPVGILHGGASGVLAETLGSVASVLVAGFDKSCVGIELNCAHLSSMKEGSVVGRVEVIRLGKRLHHWRIQIRDAADRERLICESRLTVFVQDRDEKKQ